MKRNVYLVQVNHSYGRNAFLPYSVALLQAYAQKDPVIREEYSFRGFVYLREPLVDVIQRMQKAPPDVVALSVYIWNGNYSLALARAIREAFEWCEIIVGGPHVPMRDTDKFFVDHPYIDIAVRYEGEETFRQLLLERLNQPFDDYSRIKGITYRVSPEETIRTADADRMNDLDSIPSPYLAGVFDELIKEPWDLHATQETHRGCPYQCQFCDWGTATFTKVRRFGDDRLLEEMEWFGKNKISMLYNADANYAMFERDIELTEKLVGIKQKYGFPQKFRAAFAKNSADKVYRASRLLHEADMNKGVTLSFQSMDDNTLTLVKRKNIGTEVFSQLMKRYQQEGIATYSELIIGLPGETYDSFANGIDNLLSAGQHCGLAIYSCELLPNSEMNAPEYRQRHGIKSTLTPVMTYHATPETDPHQEQYEIVTSTATLSEEDWLRTQLFSWAVQSFHCLGLTQFLSIFLKNYSKVSYRAFYEGLIGFGREKPDTLLGKALSSAVELFSNLRNGNPWGGLNSEFGNIVWPPEEFGFLSCVKDIRTFYREIAYWACDIAGLNTLKGQALIGEVLWMQEECLIAPHQEASSILALSHNIPEYIEKCTLGEETALEEGVFTYEISRSKTYSSLEDYAREVVWYGRKGGSRFIKAVRK